MSIKASSSSRPKNPGFRSRFLREKQGRIGFLLAFSKSSGNGAVTRMSFIGLALVTLVFTATVSGSVLLPSTLWPASGCELCGVLELAIGADVLLLRSVN